jgi:NarL family two-component system response regulator LiaR
MSEPVTVLIVDDHPVVRQGMEMFLETQEQVRVTGLAASGEEAVRLVKAAPPDVVLLDLNMPGMDGIEAARQIRRISPQTQVVVLTSHHEDAMVFPAVKAGALSYLLKSAPPQEILDTILAAARGEARLHPRIAKRLMEEVAGTGRSLTALTSRELEVLKLIARGYDNRAIAAALTLSEKTVKTHVSNILSKLGLTERTQAAIYALRQKIVPLDE